MIPKTVPELLRFLRRRNLNTWSPITAIEVGAGTLAAVSARRNGAGLEIVRSGSAPISPLDGPTIRKALDAWGVTDTRAVLVIPRGQALFRDLELPESTPDELVPMVRFQVEREMPMPLDQVRYSYAETGRAAGRVRLLVAAVPREIVDPAVAAVEAAGVRVEGVYVSSFGLASLHPSPEPALLVEVAGGEAEILVVEGGRMDLSRSATLPEGAPPDLLADEVERTLLAYGAKAQGRRVGKVIVAGEGADAEVLRDVIARRLTGHDVSCSGPGDLQTAVAAAVCSTLLSGRAMPDLLHPPAADRSFRFTRTRRIWAAAVLGLIVLIVTAQGILSAKESALARRREELRKLAPLAAELNTMARQTALAHRWYRDRQAWIQTFQAVAQHVNHSNLWFSSTTLEDNGQVRIEGKARDERHVTDFAAALKKSGHFPDVEIKGIRNNNDKGDFRKDFTLEALLAGFEAPKKRK